MWSVAFVQAVRLRQETVLALCSALHVRCVCDGGQTHRKCGACACLIEATDGLWTMATQPIHRDRLASGIGVNASPPMGRSGSNDGGSGVLRCVALLSVALPCVVVWCVGIALRCVPCVVLRCVALRCIVLCCDVSWCIAEP